MALLWAPLVGAVLKVDTMSDLKEFRSANPWPSLKAKDPESLRAFAAGIEGFWNDRFAFRPTLIGARAGLLVNCLGVSSSDQVVLGKEGWLFYSGEGVLDAYRVVAPYTGAQLDRFQSVLEERQRFLASHGCRYLLILVPEKQTVYPELMPDEIIPRLPKTRLDQFVEHVRANTTVEVIDLRPALMEAKAVERVFLSLDTHWNDRGAFEGYRAITSWLERNFPAVKPRRLDDFERAWKPFRRGDLPRMLALRVTEIAITLTPRSPLPVSPARPPRSKPERLVRQRMFPYATERDDPTLPRAVMYHDSFAEMFHPWLSEHFRRIAYVNGCYYGFDRQLIAEEKPDVFIHQMAERYIGDPTLR